MKSINNESTTTTKEPGSGRPFSLTKTIDLSRWQLHNAYNIKTSIP